MTENQQITFELGDVLAQTVDFLHDIVSEEQYEEIDGKCVKIVDCLWELAKYKDLGTVGDCRAALEKQIPKKPIYSEFNDNGYDEIIPYKAICPICKYEFEFGTWNDEENHHCRCGQSIDWKNGYKL